MVWHKDWICKLKGIQGSSLHLIECFLGHRYQRVLFDGQESDWLPLKAGVTQGSILGSLLFLIYINDLPDNLTSTVKLFADEACLFSTVINIDTRFLFYKQLHFWAQARAAKGFPCFQPQSCLELLSIILT